MALTVLYFAWLREAVGTGEECVDPPADVTDVAALIDWLAARGGGHAEGLQDRARIRAAVNQVHAPPDASIVGAREVALFPPVTGG